MDGDGLDADQIADRRARGVYALPFYSAEAVYFHPAVIARVASRQSRVLGTDEDALVSAATEAGVAAVRDHTGRLSDKTAKKAVPEGRVGADPERRRAVSRPTTCASRTTRRRYGPRRNANSTPPWAGMTGRRS